MKKTYCIFSAQFFPHMGGVERYTSHLAAELVKHGRQAVVVTSNPGHLPAIEKKDGYLIYRLPCWNLLKGRFPVPKPNKEFFRLHRKLKNVHFDLVAVNTRFYILSLYGAVFGAAKHVMTIVIDHGSGHLSLGHPALDLLCGIFEHLITFVLKFFCRDFYGVSRASVNWLKHFGIRAKGTLHNAVDLKEIQEMLEGEGIDYRKAYGLTADTTLVAYTGRLLPEKGVLSLAKAVKQMVSQGKDTALFLAGAGSLEKELKKFCCERIILLGELNPSQVMHLLRQADTFCLPSKSEGFSTSLLEAVACKCYVTVTKSACPRELLPDGRYAFLLDDAAPHTIARSLEYVRAHRTDCQKAARRAGRRLERHFTWERTAQKLMELENPSQQGDTYE